MITLKDGSILELNRGYKMDCLELMKQLPDNCIDLVLTDPQYGIGEDGAKNHSRSKLAKAKEYKSKAWDKNPPSRETFEEVMRISKNQIIFGVNYFDYNFTAGRIIWDKVNGNSDQSDCEIAFQSFTNSTRLFRYMWSGMNQGKSISEGHIQRGNKKLNEKRIHPTQKPLPLFKWCLEKYAIPIIEKQKIDPKDFIVADFFGGSFTTGCASHDYGFSWIITETDEDYFRDGSKRVKDYQKQELLNF